MSWVTNARREFLPDLQVQDNNVAYVKFLGEPVIYDTKKTKKTQKGNEIPDIRVHADVEYLGGSSTMAKRNADKTKSILSAKAGEKVNLWIGNTLAGKLAEKMGYTGSGDAPKLVGTMWKIWRSNERQGGNRLYDAELLKEVPKDMSATTPVDDELVLAVATDAIKKLGTVEVATFYKYLAEKTGGSEEKAKVLVEKLVAKGVVTVDGVQVKAV